MNFHRSWRSRRVTALLTLLCAATVSVSTACSSSSSSAAGGSSGGASSSSDDSSLASGLAFYKGKTITFVTNAPGGTPNTLANLFKSSLEQYLHATVNIVVAEGASAISNNRVAAAAPDGLTIGDLNVPSDITGQIFKTSGLTFSLQKVTYITPFHNGLEVILSCANSSYKSLPQIRGSKTPVRVVDASQTQNTLIMHLFIKAYQIPSKYIEGYTSTTVSPGCERGDGDIAVNKVAQFANAANTALAPGLTPLLLTAPIPSGSPFSWLSGTPTLAQYFAQNPPPTASAKEALQLATTLFGGGIGDVVFGPPGIAAGKVAALNAAFKAAMATTSNQQGLLKLGITPSYIDPSQVMPFVNSAISNEPTLAKDLS